MKVTTEQLNQSIAKHALTSDELKNFMLSDWYNFLVHLGEPMNIEVTPILSEIDRFLSYNGSDLLVQKVSPAYVQQLEFVSTVNPSKRVAFPLSVLSKADCPSGLGTSLSEWSIPDDGISDYKVIHYTLASDIKVDGRLVINRAECESFIQVVKEFAHPDRTVSDKAWEYGALKERNGITSLKAFLKWFENCVNALAPDSVEVSQRLLKEYNTLVKPRTGIVFKVDELDQLDRDGFDLLIQACYNVASNTNSTSCMTKGDPSYLGSNYYDSELHPFHAYRTRDWALMLSTDITYDELVSKFVKAWKIYEQTGEYPYLSNPEDTLLFDGAFTGRAWAVIDRGEDEEDEDTTPMYHISTVYGDCLLINRLRKGSDYPAYSAFGRTIGATVRLYVEGVEYVLPFIDGASQDVLTDEIQEEDMDNESYCIGTVCDVDDLDCDEERIILFPDVHTGLANVRERTEDCYISGDAIPPHEAVWISQLGEYVHVRFTEDGNLCPYAILRHFVG